MAAYLIVSDDFHASEYVGEYFKCREYISGFNGSAGTLVITEDMAGLWTDGRYFIQAEEQLAGTGITLFRSGQPGVVDIGTFLAEKMEDGTVLGFDGRTVSTGMAKSLKEKLREKKITFAPDRDVVGEIWANRPALSCDQSGSLAWNMQVRAGRIRWQGTKSNGGLQGGLFSDSISG